MKKLLIIGAVLSSSLLTQAQISFGPIVGMGIQGSSCYCGTDKSFNTQSPASYSFKSETKPKPVPGLSYKIGVQTNIDIVKNLALSVGLAYQTMSYKVDIEREFLNLSSVPGFSGYSYINNETHKSKLNYIALPILLQFQISLSEKVKAGFGIGPETNLLLDGQHTVSSPYASAYSIKIKAKPKVTQEDYKVNTDNDPTNDVDFHKRHNISLLIAPHVQVKAGKATLFISPTYYIGLTNTSSPVHYTIIKIVKDENIPQYERAVMENVDLKKDIKTGGFGFNIAVLFG